MATKSRNEVSRGRHVPVRQKEEGKEGKRKEPGLSEKWPSAFHECQVYIKGYGAAKKRDGNCKKGNGECLVMGGYPIPDCSVRHQNSAMITRCSKISSLLLGRLWQIQLSKPFDKWVYQKKNKIKSKQYSFL